MSRRIDVELTSARPDGTWTWRAAGAKQPKGVLDGKLLHEGAAVGDVVRAEAEFEIDGIFITTVQPLKEKKRPEPERIELLGPASPQRLVSSSLTGRPDRPRRAPRDNDAGGGGGADHGGRRGPRPGGERDGRPRRPSPGDERGGGRPGAGRDHRRPAEPEGREAGGGRAGEERGARRPAGSGRGGAQTPAPGAARPARGPRGAEHPAARPRRLVPGNAHRSAVLESLPPEHRPIAEQVLRGGIPGVRHAVEAQNATLREQGQPEVKPDALVAIAESLLPRLKAAEWKDRAEAAAKAVDEIALRDLRSVVAGSDAARDDEARLLAGTLREALDRRTTEQRDRWLSDISSALDEGRVVRALRSSARPPDPGTRFPAELALRLSEAAGAAMAADTPPDRWGTLLEAVAESPVRRSVKPAGLPADAPEDLLHTARRASGRVPALAPLLGIEMPPPPGPPRPTPRSARPPRRPAHPRPTPPAPRRGGVTRDTGEHSAAEGVPPSPATGAPPPASEAAGGAGGEPETGAAGPGTGEPPPTALEERAESGEAP